VIEVVYKGSLYAVFKEYPHETYPSGKNRVFFFNHLTVAPCRIMQMPDTVTDLEI
jgi:hypothetical protein